MGARGDEALSRIDEAGEPAVVVGGYGGGEAGGSDSGSRTIVRRRLGGSSERTLPELSAGAESSFRRNGGVGLLFPRRLHERERERALRVSKFCGTEVEKREKLKKVQIRVFNGQRERKKNDRYSRERERERERV